MTSTSRAAPPTLFPAGGRVSAAVTPCARGAGQGLTCSSSGAQPEPRAPLAHLGKAPGTPPAATPPPALRAAGGGQEGLRGGLRAGQGRGSGCGGRLGMAQRFAGRIGPRRTGGERPGPAGGAGGRRRLLPGSCPPPRRQRAPPPWAAFSATCHPSSARNPGSRGRPQGCRARRCLGASRRSGWLCCALLLRAPRRAGTASLQGSLVLQHVLMWGSGALLYVYSPRAAEIIGSLAYLTNLVHWCSSGQVTLDAIFKTYCEPRWWYAADSFIVKEVPKFSSSLLCIN